MGKKKPTPTSATDQSSKTPQSHKKPSAARTAKTNSQTPGSHTPGSHTQGSQAPGSQASGLGHRRDAGPAAESKHIAVPQEWSHEGRAGEVAGRAAVSATEADASYNIVRRALLQLWDVIGELARIEAPAHPRYRVTIFGSARIQREDDLYRTVRELASQLTFWGCDIITGGGPGLMEAANEGENLADPNKNSHSVGIRVDLPFEQRANPFVEDLYEHRTFFSRLHHFVLISDAFLVVPGGIGTLLETALVWQLLQVRKLHNVPLILLGTMWRELVDWANSHMINQPLHLASPQDMTIPHCVDSIDEALEGNRSRG